MARYLGVSPSAVALRFLGILFASVRVYYGQETEPRWDLSETGDMTFTWPGAIAGLLAALGFCGLWRFVVWFLETKRARINWRAVCYWWPTAMLAWGGMMTVADLAGASKGVVFNSIFLIYALVNLHALIVVVLVLGLCDQLAARPRWIIASIAMWAASHVIVRLAEWRAWINTVISLHIAGNDTDTDHIS
jgi:hypothetical protein